MARDNLRNNSTLRSTNGRTSQTTVDNVPVIGGNSITGLTKTQSAYDYLFDASQASWLSGLPFIGSGADAYSQYMGQLASMLYNEGQSEINRDFVTSEREASQMFYEYMWNKNNEYNSLKNQVKRAEEAGFTPNAVLGNQPPIQPISTPQGTSAGFASVGDLGSDYANRGLQRKLLQSQIDKTKSESTFIDEQAEGQRLDNEYSSATLDVRIEQQNQFYSNMVSQGLLTDAQYNEISARLPYVSALSAEDLRMRKAQADNYEMEFNRIVADIQRIYKDMEVADSQISVNESIVDVNRSVEELNYSHANRNDWESLLTQYELRLKEIEVEASSLVGLPTNASTGAFIKKEWSEFKNNWKQKDLLQRVGSVVGLASTALLFVPGVGSSVAKGAKAVGKRVTKFFNKPKKVRGFSERKKGVFERLKDIFNKGK